MLLTWFGHGSFRIEYGNNVLYLDPYAGDADWYDKPANLVLISKNEYDHWSRSLLNKITVDGTHLFGSADVAREVFGCRPFAPGDFITFDDGTRVQATAAVVRRRESVSEGLGWLITIGRQTLYFVGDTDILPNLLNVKADIVIIPVGGTWTMSAKDAITVVRRITPRIAIPAHYGSQSGTIDDAELFREAVEPSYTNVLVLEPNREVTL
ncbi:MAG TPA: MBL fold metallo-hydrolase [Candidatus Binatia bacterium]|nr:MBL fold metallo-hydrolase [Candidatus Binatia bacterium]